MTSLPATAVDTAYTRAQVERRCEAALQAADVAGVFPVPIDRVLHSAGVEDIIDISQLPASVAATKPRILKRLLGALMPREQAVFIDFDQVTGRVLWTKGHEATHKILPWHEAAVVMDDGQRLFRDSAEELEIEANLGAAYLIFQGGRTMNRALDYRHSLDTALVLAPEVGASISATIRFYVEHHPEPMALLQTGRIRGQNGHVPIYLHTASPSWSIEFPHPSQQFQGSLNIGTAPLVEVVTDAQDGGHVGSITAHLPNRNGDNRPIVVESFDNRYNLFFLLRRQRRVELGRRVRAVGAVA